MEKDERTEDSVIVASVQFVALKLACPHCAAPIALRGRLELMPGQRATQPCCVCERCGHATYLALDPVSG
ncbi:MAG: hypothetical protein M3Q71_14345 [Chloroflexota bacterium]|nr:hypothetical protein [Chloroflexota bacterium]